MAEAVMTALRLLHIGAGIALVGGATMWTMLQPTLQQMGPTLPKGFLPTVGGKVVRFLPHAALATFLTGLALYWLMLPVAVNATWRMLMMAAMGLMLVSLAVAYGGVLPTFRKLSQAWSALQGPPGPDVMALQARLKALSMVNLAAAWLIVVLMVVATALRTT